MSIVRGIKRLLLLQLLVCACISIIMAIILGYVAAKSAFLAGAVCILPNVLFARKLFYYQGARSAKQIVNSSGVYVCRNKTTGVLSDIYCGANEYLVCAFIE